MVIGSGNAEIHQLSNTLLHSGPDRPVSPVQLCTTESQHPRDFHCGVPFFLSPAHSDFDIWHPSIQLHPHKKAMCACLVQKERKPGSCAHAPAKDGGVPTRVSHIFAPANCFLSEKSVSSKATAAGLARKGFHPKQCKTLRECFLTEQNQEGKHWGRVTHELFLHGDIGAAAVAARPKIRAAGSATPAAGIGGPD